MKLVQIKPVRGLFLEKEQTPLKTVPVDRPADGSPLQETPWAADGTTEALMSSVHADKLHLNEHNGIHIFQRHYFAILHILLSLTFVYCRYNVTLPKLIALGMRHFKE